jgi:hypothetical protein
MTENTPEPTVTFDPFVQMAREKLVTMITDNNVVAERLRSVGNTRALVKEIREDKPTEDTVILEFRQKMEKAQAEMNKWEADVDAHIKASGMVTTGDVDVEKETAAWKAAHSAIKPMRDVLQNLGGDAAVAGLPEIKGIPGKSGGTAAGASGISRPRLQKIRYTVAGKEEWVEVYTTVEVEGSPVQKTTLTNLAAALNKAFGSSVSAADIQSPMFDAAGTKDLSTRNGEPVSFAFTAGETNVIIEVTPRVS